MKLMKTEDAVGQVLCHDITQIIKGVTKDAVFRKGHIITEEDIPVLLSVGKDNIYIWEKDDTMLHENEAAQILYDMCKNDHMHPSDVKEGKIELIADCDGLLKVDREKLKKVNSLGEMMIATRHGDTYVKKGDKLAGTRIIPLVIKKEKMETAQAVCSDGPILTLKPFHKKKFAVLTTGNEVYYHRIEDTFTPVIQEKLAEFGAEMIFHEVYDDDASKITDGCRRAGFAGRRRTADARRPARAAAPLRGVCHSHRQRSLGRRGAAAALPHPAPARAARPGRSRAGPLQRGKGISGRALRGGCGIKAVFSRK